MAAWLPGFRSTHYPAFSLCSAPAACHTNPRCPTANCNTIPTTNPTARGRGCPYSTQARIFVPLCSSKVRRSWRGGLQAVGRWAFARNHLTTALHALTLNYLHVRLCLPPYVYSSPPQHVHRVPYQPLLSHHSQLSVHNDLPHCLHLSAAQSGL